MRKGSGLEMGALTTTPGRRVRFTVLAAAVLLLSIASLVSVGKAAAADAAFQKFLADLWPQAQGMGVSRATFEAATRNLEPDYGLPDLVIPGRERAPSSQPEF